MTPAETLQAIAARFADLPQLPPGTPDAFTHRQAPAMLYRLATKIESEDPATVAQGRDALLAIGAAWRDRQSSGALLWAEACAAIGEAMPEKAETHQPTGPDAAMVLMLAGAYERGRAKGREEMRERCAAIADERITYGLADTIARDIREVELK